MASETVDTQQSDFIKRLEEGLQLFLYSIVLSVGVKLVVPPACHFSNAPALPKQVGHVDAAAQEASRVGKKKNKKTKTTLQKSSLTPKYRHEQFPNDLMYSRKYAVSQVLSTNRNTCNTTKHRAAHTLFMAKGTKNKTKQNGIPVNLGKIPEDPVIQYNTFLLPHSFFCFSSHSSSSSSFYYKYLK